MIVYKVVHAERPDSMDWEYTSAWAGVIYPIDRTDYHHFPLKYELGKETVQIDAAPSKEIYCFQSLEGALEAYGFNGDGSSYERKPGSIAILKCEAEGVKKAPYSTDECKVLSLIPIKVVFLNRR